MAENLNYKTENSYCYDDYDSNCDIMGRLYPWSVAKEVCPEGWHLPTDEEWNTLINLFDSKAIHLKSTSELWARDGKGTNKSLFNAMPYGYATFERGYAYYTSFQLQACFWSSTEKNEGYGWDWNLTLWATINRWEGNKNNSNSVRCVKN